MAKVEIRNCPKSLGRPYNVALRDTEMVLFGPFWGSYTGQIYGRNPASTPFRTVSLGDSVNSGQESTSSAAGTLSANQHRRKGARHEQLSAYRPDPGGNHRRAAGPIDGKRI